MTKQLRAILFTLAGVTLAVAIGDGDRAFAQSNSSATQSKTIDCSVDGAQYTCSRTGLASAFAEARTVALESQPKDRLADGELASFVKSLGKLVVPAQGPADITLRLVRTGSTGISVGSFDVELGTLRVFSTRTGKSNSHLLWVETYRGQQDVPWPAVVHELTGQLQAALSGSDLLQR